MLNKIILLIFISALFTSIFVSGACATNSSALIFDFTPETSNDRVHAQSMQSAEFVPLNLKLAKISLAGEEIVWAANITDPADVVLNVDTGTYAVYFQFSGHRTVWEDNNNDLGYIVRENETTTILLNFNTQNKDVFADAPWRVEPDKMLPILLMVKDATGFDYDIGYISIYLDQNKDESNSVNGDILLNSTWYGLRIYNRMYNLYYAGDWYNITWLDPEEYGLNGTVYLHVVFDENGGFLDPDYDAHSHLRINIGDSPLPTFSDWYPGDTHYHSIYTDNMVEFGNPIEATRDAGKTVGLNWITITDHSFDLDSTDEIGKWQCLKNECQIYDSNEFKLILGEEVSTYNADSNVIHFLAYNIDNFIPGNRDKPYELNQETWHLQDVIDNVTDQGGVSYAAHPTGHPSGEEAFFLDRGNWTYADYLSTGLHGLQFWNTKTGDWEQNLNEGLNIWIDLLLSGKHIYAIGGTDAHGDFNNHYYCTGIPYLSAARDWDSAMGCVRTYVHIQNLSEVTILDSLKNGNSIMTDGPLVIFDINGETIGNNVVLTNETNATLRIRWNSTKEFGNITTILVKKGVIGKTDDRNVTILTPSSIGKDPLSDEYEFVLLLNESCYYRIEAYSKTTEGEEFRCYTNPIWVVPEQPSIGPKNEITVGSSNAVIIGQKLMFQGTDLGKCIVGKEPETIEYCTFGTATDNFNSAVFTTPGTYFVDANLNAYLDPGETTLSVAALMFNLSLKIGGYTITSTTEGQIVNISVTTNIPDAARADIKVTQVEGSIPLKVDGAGQNLENQSLGVIDGFGLDTTDFDTGAYEIYIKTDKDEADGLDVSSNTVTLAIYKEEINIDTDTIRPGVNKNVKFTVFGPPDTGIVISTDEPDVAEMLTGVEEIPGGDPSWDYKGEFLLDGVNPGLATNANGKFTFVMQFNDDKKVKIMVRNVAGTLEDFIYIDVQPIISWNVTISATNQLEPVVVGGHPNATDGYDPAFDAFSQAPVQGKVILLLDDFYSTSIKKTRYYNESVSWNLSVGVPTGQTTTLSWQVPANVNLTVLEGDVVLPSGSQLGAGTHELTVITGLLEEYPEFCIDLKAGWNMVSIPVIPDDSSIQAMFGSIPTLATMPVKTWVSPLFVTVEEIEPKKGYWVFTPTATTICVAGKPITNTTLNLKAGWNLISTAGLENMTIAEIPNQVPMCPAVTWVSPSFVETDVIEPGKAAWAFVTQDTVLTIA